MLEHQLLIQIVGFVAICNFWRSSAVFISNNRSIYLVSKASECVGQVEPFVAQLVGVVLDGVSVAGIRCVSKVPKLKSAL